MQKKKEKW